MSAGGTQTVHVVLALKVLTVCGLEGHTGGYYLSSV